MISTVAKSLNTGMHELRALFEKQLRQLYWAEQQMSGIIASVIDACYSADLVAALKEHRVKNLSHVNRLQRIFSISGIEAVAEPYEALACFLKEVRDIITATRAGVVRDAGIISVLQKMGHYEIACYGTMRAYAIALREEEAIPLLELTLDE
ncbi:hypothetical protein CHU92_08375 [Flavobacterium cyanobacteriorum]|uniref:Uncharacterized protein n=1 Tax=Flavobacterium cyanobacteriorum TaxID=2022802 RepID=A0A255Z7E2_9FLAO|nr:DUF892 family protein [Flavobacterium cyanobacteriorum]OYQ37341.1 hypothetical protein CHU92_08375 [Flavobacterium cyanobacteriorum]